MDSVRCPSCHAPIDIDRGTTATKRCPGCGHWASREWWRTHGVRDLDAEEDSS